MGKSKEIKKTDGRKYNKRLAPKPISTKNKIVPARTTKAKSERISSYGIAGMKDEFGSEKEFFKFLAKQARTNFNAMKLLMEYSYGKVSDRIDQDNKRNTKSAPVINFNVNQIPQLESDNTIDITDDQ